MRCRCIPLLRVRGFYFCFKNKTMGQDTSERIGGNCTKSSVEVQAIKQAIIDPTGKSVLCALSDVSTASKPKI